MDNLTLKNQIIHFTEIQLFGKISRCPIKLIFYMDILLYGFYKMNDVIHK